MKIINLSPIWVLGSDELNLVRVTTNENYVGGRDFFDCSKWINRENALRFAKKFDELTLYRVDEFEDGRNRSIIKFVREKID